MDQANWNKIDQLLDEILVHDHPEKQKQILKSRCQDPDVYKEVLQILDSIHESGSFWPQLFQANEKLADTLSNDQDEMVRFPEKIEEIHSGDELVAPEVIGNYNIKKRIGKGGMGDVYLAERKDHNFHQNVALKVIRNRGTTGKEFLRFEQERLILSTLSHPNIAKFLDGGISSDGRAFYVMEFVDGIPLTDYCIQNSRTLEKRLNLFMQLCKAVQYAHSNSIVHRDLKPENLLVTKDGTIKILDFGIAKMLNTTPGAASLRITSEGGQMLTWQYCAPEQLTMDPITTATDIYTLGLLLYELLNDQPAFDLDQKTYTDIHHTILHEAATAPSLSKASNESLSDPELDAIVLKALRKVPGERYQSAQHMIDDILRYQNKLPVLARQGSTYYVFKKFLRRNALSLSAAAIILLLLAGSSLFHTSQINEERNLAQLQAQRAEEATTILIDLFKANQPGNISTADVSLNQFLELGTQKADNLQNYPELKANMYSVIGQIYRTTGDLEKAEHLINNAYLIYKNLYGESHPETLSMIDHFGMLLINKGEFHKAEELLANSLKIKQKSPTIGQASIAQTINNLAYAKRRMGNLDEAEQLFHRGYDIRENVLGSEHPLTLESLSSLAVVMHNKSNYVQSEIIYRELIEKRGRILGKQHPDYIAIVSSLGALLMNTGNFSEAEYYLKEALELRRRILGDNHPDVAITVNNLGILKTDMNELEEAKSYFEEALQLRKNTIGDDHINTAISKFSYANLLMKESRADTALTLLEEALVTFKDGLPDDHSFIARTRLRIGLAMLETGSFDQAEDIIVDAYRSILSIHHNRSLERALADISYGKYLVTKGDISQAREIWQHARSILLELEGDSGVRQAEVLALINN